MMDTAHRDLLVRWRAQLVDEIDILHGLLSHLKSRKVLSARMAQDLTVGEIVNRSWKFYHWLLSLAYIFITILTGVFLHVDDHFH